MTANTGTPMRGGRIGGVPVMGGAGRIYGGRRLPGRARASVVVGTVLAALVLLGSVPLPAVAVGTPVAPLSATDPAARGAPLGVALPQPRGVPVVPFGSPPTANWPTYLGN